jgi:hypothetical protein
MLLDTGAELTILTSAAVARVGLRPDPWVSTSMRGAGGLVERRANVDVRMALAGTVPLFQRQPGAGLILPVTTSGLGGADGLLGGDVLRHCTIALDIQAARLSLNAAPPGAGAVRLQSLRRNLLLAPVELDGHRLLALVDTGASRSLINASGLYRLGLAPSLLAQNQPVPIQTVGGASIARPHRFATLRIGALTLAQPTLLTVPIPEPAFDLILGLDVLGRQPMRLSYTGMTLGFEG